MPNPRGHAWRKLRDQVLANATHCALCGLPLIPDAPPRSRWSSTVDHIWPIALGGDALPPIDALRPAHYGCNVRLGNRTVPRRRGRPSRAAIVNASRDW